MGVSATAAKSRRKSCGRGQPDVAREQMPGLRLRDDVVAQCGRGAEHTEEPTAERTVLQQGAVQFVPAVPERLGEAHHGPQSAIGVRGARQRPQQLNVIVGVPAQRIEVCPGVRLDEPSLPTLGSVGRWVAGLGTPPTVSQVPQSER